MWIPVDKATFEAKFKRTEGYSKGDLEDLLKYCGEADATGVNQYLSNKSITEDSSIADEAKNMYYSVKSNGGFYIGRYEAGIEEKDPRQNLGYDEDYNRIVNISDNVVIKKNKHVYNFIGWSSWNDMDVVTGGAVEKSRNYNAASNSNGFKFANDNIKAKTTLCYGVQWDAALNFIDSNYITNEKENGNPNCSSGSYLVNSTGKGWYYDNCSTGNSAHKTGIDVNTNKNIYDMAGNILEWTMESGYAGDRVLRGGSYYDTGTNSPASSRIVSSPASAAEEFGFRPTLYLWR